MFILIAIGNSDCAHSVPFKWRHLIPKDGKPMDCQMTEPLEAYLEGGVHPVDWYVENASNKTAALGGHSFPLIPEFNYMGPFQIFSSLSQENFSTLQCNYDSNSRTLNLKLNDGSYLCKKNDRLNVLCRELMSIALALDERLPSGEYRYPVNNLKLDLSKIREVDFKTISHVIGEIKVAMNNQGGSPRITIKNPHSQVESQLTTLYDFEIKP